MTSYTPVTKNTTAVTNINESSAPSYTNVTKS